MARQYSKRQSTTTKPKIFISWSGDNSKTIACALKDRLENGIFNSTGLECFVSEMDISSGDDWWNKIKTELNNCKLGIICITKENVKAPWIFFESGAMVARDLKVIPLLINCDWNALSSTPLSSKHRVDFYKQEKFIKMILDINKELSLLTLSDENISTIVRAQYEILKKELDPVLKKLKSMRIFNEKYIYPQKINTVIRNTIYISAPMSSIGEDEYQELRRFLLEIQPKLNDLGFTKVICPLYDVPIYGNFHGSTKAIKDNFIEMKQADAMIAIFPKMQPSSTLIEIGYAIALSKKTLIFYREKLPYMLEDAGINIEHVNIHTYKGYSDIMHTIDSNGKQLFGLDEED